MLRSVAVIALPEVAVFELGVLCELFGYDRTAEGLPAYEFAVCSVDGVGVRQLTAAAVAPFITGPGAVYMFSGRDEKTAMLMGD